MTRDDSSPLGLPGDDGGQPQDKGAMFRAMLWAMTAFLAWTLIANWIWPPKPRNGEVVTTPPAPQVTPDGGHVVKEGEGDTTGTETPPITPGGIQIVGAASEVSFELGSLDSSEDGLHRMHVVGSNRGASISSVQLTDYAAVVKQPERYTLLSPGLNKLGESQNSFTIERIFAGDPEQEIDLSKALWNVETQKAHDADTATLTLDLVNDGKPLLTLKRLYRVPVQPRKFKRYDFFVDLEVVNRTDRQLPVRLVYRGPVGIPKADMRFDDRGLITGMISTGGSKPIATLLQASNLEGKSDHPLDDAEIPQTLSWVALTNKYFAALVAPADYRAATQPSAAYRAIQSVDLDETKSDPHALNSDLTMRFITETKALPPSASQQYSLECYLGPKTAKVLHNDENPEYLERNYYGLIPASYNVGACAFMTPTWLVDFMLWLLGTFKAVVFNYGLAIIVMVLGVRALLHPLTKKTQVNMVRMQERMSKLQPKLEELKKRFANDKARLNQEQMKLMHEEGINPAGQMMTCLPMFVQMPIWIALYTSLSYNIDLRHQPFMLWIRDLTAPDAMFKLFDPPGLHIPLLGAMMGPVTTFNLLPLLLAVAMYLQQKLMPKPANQPPPGSAAAEQQAAMQRMMPIMSVMFAVFMYNMPSGLTLYIMSSTIFGTLEQMRIRKHIEKKKQEGDLFKPTDRGKRQRKPGMWDKLMQMADEAQKQQASKK